MELRFLRGDSTIVLHADPFDGAGWRIRLPDGSEQFISVRRLPDERVEVSAGDRTYQVPFAQTAAGTELSWEGQTYLFEPAAGPAKARKDPASTGGLASPMVGVVADVLVQDGQTVETYQPLVVIEAMKVLATLEAPFPGTVSLRVTKGSRVAHGEIVAVVTPAAEGG